MEASLFIAALVIIAVGDGLLQDYKQHKENLRKRKKRYGHRI